MQHRKNKASDWIYGMKITKTQLSAWQATRALLNWFSIRFPEGGANYQDVLDALATDDLPDDAHWLMDQAGVDNCGQVDITTPEGRMHVNHVFAAGKLTVSPSFNITGWLRAGLSIDAKKSLRADRGLIAGWNIRACGSIQTEGKIKAGTRIDVGMNIVAGEGISSACAITAGGDIQSGKGIHVGTAFGSTAKALEEFYSDDVDILGTMSLALQKLWAASSGSGDYWDAIVDERRSLFGVEASGNISSGSSITSATTIKAGDSITAIDDIQAGRSIHAGGNVIVGRSIHGGWTVFVEGSIRARNEIVATSIEAKGGIRSEGNIFFTTDLKSGGDILADGDVRQNPNNLWGNISAVGELRVGGEVECEGNIHAARVVVKGNLTSGRNVRTDGDIITGNDLFSGGYIKSLFGNISGGLGINAGGIIQAARSIQAGTEIVAGDDCGIFAATGLKFAEWKAIGQVVAQQRPVNLISGYWAEKAVPEFSDNIPIRVKLKTPWLDDSGLWQRPGTIIKVIGIGISGGNSVDHMIRKGMSGVEFAVVDTDLLELSRRSAEVRIQFGGIDDEACATAANAARELARIDAFLADAHLVFIVAGVECVIDNGVATTIAKVAREQGIFSVAVVSVPALFKWELDHSFDSGFRSMQRHIDSVVMIHNDNELTTPNEDEQKNDAFKTVNLTASDAVDSIGLIINIPGLNDVDFEEIRTVMSAGESPVAVMASGIASGPDRARMAIERVVLLDGFDLGEAQGILVNITAMRGLKMKEVSEAMSSIRKLCNDDIHVAFGARYDERMGEDMRVTVVAVMDRDKVKTRF